MRLLFCCEFYWPSVGGVQEVMRQIAENMVRKGHSVTVATTRLSNRPALEHNGVRIVEFDVSGNAPVGMTGSVEEYQRFVSEFQADALLVKATQQWTFDALWPILDILECRKVLIPCGCSGMFNSFYSAYYAQLPEIWRKFDHLIFYSRNYRDIEFARQHNMSHFSIVPNGADQAEFEAAPDGRALRRQLGIGENDFVFSTVGSLTGSKGHEELAEAFALMETGGRPVTLVLNGNRPDAVRNVRAILRHLRSLYRQYGFRSVVHRVLSLTVRPMLSRLRGGGAEADPVAHWMKAANAQPGKTALLVNLPRPQVVELFRATDLFVLASRIEYSPLVLFEAAAAGTPFLTVPVGNAEEIIEWTRAGMLCPAERDAVGCTRVSPAVLARHMETAMADPQALRRMGEAGHARWREHFTWDVIAGHYEAVLAGNAITREDAQGLSSSLADRQRTE